ncbi:guanitoxin biosynthesis MATE family efflux transporter GntT [Microcoleus sp. AR_TQ3_B6]|uniref:guanitoxin biosynthesis MATE family efflux transporter GntT n=1 Tax=Microcoleus sp. AR_TQ3_B6 TaxID=3055284 RepID=UPI002FD20ADE
MNITLPKQYDFLPRFSRLVITNILSNITIPLASLIAAAFLGHLPDIRHLAGVILASILFEYLYQVLACLRSTTNGMTAQAVGEDDREAMLLGGLRNGLIALALGTLILTLHYPLGEMGFALLSASKEVKDAGISYFNLRIWAAPAVALNFVLIGWFLGQQMNGFVLLLTFVGNGANIVLAYLFIIQWGWESAGAGLATAISQYLSLLGGLILVCFNIKWQELLTATQKILDWSALKAAFILNGNIFIRYVALSSTLAIFTSLSSALGTTFLAENGLLMQVVELSLFVIQGVGYATSSLAGNFKGQGAYQQLVSLLRLATVTSLFLALSIALVCVFFPETVFGLLTNHAEITEQIDSYVTWLIPVLCFSATSLMLEGYFIGLTEGKVLRDSALAAFGVGFAPMAIVAWYLHSNHILWLALASYMAAITVLLGVQLLRTFGSYPVTIEPISDRPNSL